MISLSLWQLGKRCLFKSLILCSLVVCCCLAAAPCSAAVGVKNGTQRKLLYEPINFPLARGVRVAPSGRLPSLLKRLAGSITAGICALSTALHYDVISSACNAAVWERFCGSKIVQTSSVDCLTTVTNVS